MNNPFTARWTAKEKNLCLGHWEIEYQGKPLELSFQRRKNDMGTYGVYSYDFPDDEQYAEGLSEADWVIENVQWLLDLFERHQIPFDESLLRQFYRAVNTEDWRCDACGGCINA